jgi:hypothetical protein
LIRSSSEKIAIMVILDKFALPPHWRALGRSFLGNRSTSIEVFPGKRLGVRCYGGGMNAEPLIAEIAGLVGEPARATMLSTLLAMAELSPIPRTVAS